MGKLATAGNAKDHILACIRDGHHEAAWNVARAMDPADWQAANAEFDDVVVTIDAGRRRTSIKTRQRAQDARVLGAIDEVPSGARAAVWISVGFRVVADGAMPRAPQYGRDTVDEGDAVDPGRVADFLIDARDAYLAWQAECQKRRISTRPIIDILVWGASLSTTDALNRKRKGWSRASLTAGIAAFVDMNGWESAAALQPWTQRRVALGQRTA